MKKFIILIVAIVALGAWIMPQYNNLVKLDEGVNAKWAQVQNQYKRRADLIPNLVQTVKGYAKHESQTLQNVIEARSKATSINLNASDLSDQAKMKAFVDAQNSLSSALSKLMVVVEKYPELKADESFLKLQDQLEGTENRIAIARKDYIDELQGFNTVLRSFPTNLIAKIFTQISPKESFKASENEQNAPQVSF
ncbi:LemA family protein [Campylobacter sp. 19-13652]|uniref:LemA family protein n=1 Tax=Campylobacter sp. 19-13652 TaxID=2840180 RepID=UPI001C75C04E|nr:LemA family protein [Campylobacter sp. 19-13652]BCX80051.1 hypothetical protein LBC_15130 [Campylobacter sp. 19-13652]